MFKHRRTKIRWILVIGFTVIVGAFVIYKIECLNDFNKTSLVDYKFPSKSLLSYMGNTTESLRKHLTSSVSVPKHITKSLKQLGKMDEVNKHFLFLNSVPKSGSEILVFLLERIQGENNFKHVRLKGGNKRKLNKIQQEEMVEEIYDIRRNMAIPLSFDRTVYFINFTSFDRQLPIYFNLIRHPITKVMTRALLTKTGTYDSYFIRCLLDAKRNCNFKNGRPYDLTIPYFCGHDPRCMLLNDNWAFEKAKSNVEKYYQVVGVLEEMNITLQVLETKIPQFFSGVKSTYQRNLLENYKNKKDPDIPEEIEISLRKTLVKEMEFYYWIKNRLLSQANKT
ncbi:hypothetical protein ABEB36_008968 [Hypothenemus hampei]|uniref:Uronyl 2-sulfotransferase n=1 Tax=Hypothenemus hampei TaxID=57062 RepID=A0ABD1ENM8_HYPHA